MRPSAPSWRDWRNRLLASPRFQRLATAFPLTRPIARRRSRALFDLCAGFVYSQVLAACVELDVFDALSHGPRGLDDLAKHIALPREPLARLLEAATALRLLERRRGGFGLGSLGAALQGNPGVKAMIRHHRLLYADLQDPLALLKRGEGDSELGRLWPYARGAEPAALGAAEVAPYTALMAASQAMVADEILAVWRLGRHRCLLDVGGGDGSFLVRAGAAAPDLRLMLFDLPSVVAQAQCRFRQAGLGERAQVFGGDIHRDALPPGADAVSLIRVIHDHDDAAAAAILRAAWHALPPGGALLLAEPMAGTAGAAGMEAYFAFYLLAMGSGRPRRAEELRALVEAAGFEQVRLINTRQPLLVRLLVARRGA